MRVQKSRIWASASGKCTWGEMGAKTGPRLIALSRCAALGSSVDLGASGRTVLQDSGGLRNRSAVGGPSTVWITAGASAKLDALAPLALARLVEVT